MTPTLSNIYREASIIVMVTFLSEATRMIQAFTDNRACIRQIIYRIYR